MLINQFPEVFLSTREIANKVAQELKKGNIRKIGPRLYTEQGECRFLTESTAS